MFNAHIKRIAKKILTLAKINHIIRLINRDKAIILMYHNFCNEFDKEHTNICMPISDFENQIKYLKKYYTIIPLAELVDRIAKKKKFLPYSVAITFDDGYKNNFLLAYEVIKKYNIPITIFLTSGYINTNKTLWVNELEYAINKTLKKEINIAFDSVSYKYYIRNKSEKTKAYEIIKLKLKELDSSELKRTLQNLFFQLENNGIYERAANYRMLSWDNIFMMDAGLVSYGSHTVSHPILTKIGHSDLTEEILESKLFLELKLKRNIDFFCFPNGVFNNEILNIVKKEYTAAFTVTHGFITKHSDLYRLPRVGANSQLLDFIWQLLRPTLNINA